MTNDWWVRPTSLREFNADIDYILFLDENGHADHIKNMKENALNSYCNDRNSIYFTVTGCAINRNDFPVIRQSLIDLKNSYWPPNGEYNYKGRMRKVCFRSRNIRRKDSPFSSKEIDRENFLNDLSNFISDSRFTIFSTTVNMEELLKYSTPRHPYNLCMDFIFERFGKYFLKRTHATGVVVLEARGKKEDASLLLHCSRILKHGTSYASSSDLNLIKGVYFNNKWSIKQWNFKKSYFGLELADLVSYPIHKYIRNGSRDLAFSTIEPKFYGYPNYFGKGLKVFP
ncbi:DUF3800 domain-containing protein [Desulfotruncus alcoholivorax]|uniref:DUF3800 domain-containing protein n=1 Tax=Desulfotruncus alcoholivorax TaxID=265477 RepID=UPI00041E07E5|nr:DUF3800 domain-containing protein [Desulfotruncus alcoholivorax]